MKAFLRSVAAKVPCDPDRLRVVCTVHGSVVELLDSPVLPPDRCVLAGSPIEHGEDGASRFFAEVLGRQT